MLADVPRAVCRVADRLQRLETRRDHFLVCFIHGRAVVVKSLGSVLDCDRVLDNVIPANAGIRDFGYERIKMILKSTFSDGDRLPDEYANTGVKSGRGKNISPPFRWEEAAAETKSFALIMVDYQAVSGPFVHWLVVDIPADAREIEAGASLTAKMPAGAWELNTDYGRPGYGGAGPPADTGEHGYKTTVYALSVDRLDIEADTGLKEFEKALAGKVLTSAQLTGVYSQ